MTTMDSAILRTLKESGWVFSQDELLKYIEEEYEEEIALNNADDWSKFLLNVDLHKIAEQSQGITLNHALQRPQILQIDKIRNVALPKINENDEKNCPRILKLVLTDGHSSCLGLEIARINGLSADSPPGTKIWLSGSTVPFERNFFLLNNSNCKILGGNVEELVEKWKANRETRGKQRQSGAGGAPAWVPFGKSVDTTANLTRGFESMSITKNETGPPVSEQFEQNRSAVIAQVQASGTTARFQHSSTAAPGNRSNLVADAVPPSSQENFVPAYQNRQNQHQQQYNNYSQQHNRGGGYSGRGGNRGGRSNRGGRGGGGGGGGGGGRVFHNSASYMR